jgi:hypothetical protein
MKRKKKLDASKFASRDATENERLIIYVRGPHFKKAVPGDPEHCPIVIAAMDEHPLMHFVCHRTFSYALFKGETTYVRYQNPPDARTFLEVFDVDKKKLLATVPDQGYQFIFRRPQETKLLAYTRSDAAKRRRNLSRAKNKNKKTKRRYRAPDPKTLSGVRSHFGYTVTQ